jgi:hypothetical protein
MPLLHELQICLAAIRRRASCKLHYARHLGVQIMTRSGQECPRKLLRLFDLIWICRPLVAMEEFDETIDSGRYRGAQSWYWQRICSVVCS